MLTDPDHFMSKAFRLARAGMGKTGHRPFACVIVKDGNVVGQAVSQSRNSLDVTSHGEVLAIRDASKRLASRDLSDCELYTTCEPCPMCVAAIWYAKISKMYYAFTLRECEAIGVSTKELVEELQRPVDQRKLPSVRIKQEEGKRLFVDWQEAPNFVP
ncbi:nucleoside deaminase [Bradyrhizobium canariense]|uniref:tRNA(Arg) A34 adenosine deaminase TadA n=1 Tax=Bradyrhizobium canariense TaxID=255045 RepID=A0A1H1YQX4_9BRAD|nr:nucleoside deaminase [Bradyrhizobium canariense]SDT23516.1 tRNA(Arg) A34 adenosine deaminase TadA [Bradyrhizobium canariense]